MPSIHYRQDNLQQLGPVIRLQITPVSDLLAKLDVLGEPAPRPSEATALVDTGSEVTAVDREIIRDLGLEPTGFVSVRTPGRLYQACRQYSLRLVLDEGIEVEAAALELDFGGGPVNCILGRDVLSLCSFSYDGPASSFSLSF